RSPRGRASQRYQKRYRPLTTHRPRARTKNHQQSSAPDEGEGKRKPYALAAGGDLSPSPTSRTREEQEGRKALGPSVR
uniref:Uncharacterized protein n=1 Tax=Aegilops tauschii subsp. strangulata TaxID=200361 RepID=A0A453KJN8_AEGTS